METPRTPRDESPDLLKVRSIKWLCLLHAMQSENTATTNSFDHNGCPAGHSDGLLCLRQASQHHKCRRLPSVRALEVGRLLEGQYQCDRKLELGDIHAQVENDPSDITDRQKVLRTVCALIYTELNSNVVCSCV